MRIYKLKYISIIILLSLIGSSYAFGQYFGQNKVNYEQFNFEIYETPHFEIYNYLDQNEAIQRLGRQTEHWYDRHFSIFRDTVTNNPLIVYNNHADFQQTTVISGQIGVGTGGVTEGLRKRVVIPFMVSNRETDHVLGHEMVHVFQYNLVKVNDSLGLESLQNIPLWMIEGMAEYLSIGPEDNKTAMWMRDAVIHDDVPSIEDMTRRPNQYFPYRYGHAFWAFVTGIWGDAMIKPYLQSTARYGIDRATENMFGLSADSLSSLFQKSVRKTYEPYIQEDSIQPVGRAMFTPENSGELNLSPVLSPNGEYITFISNKNVISVDILMARTEDRQVIKKLSSALRQTHIDNFNYIESAGSWSPDGTRYVMKTFAKGRNMLLIADVEGDDVDVSQEIMIKGVQSFDNPEWSPDGEKILLTGLVGGQSDLYLYHLKSGKVEQLTDDRYSDLQATWSSDGEQIVFISERGNDTNLDKQIYGNYRLCRMDVESRNVSVLPVFPGSDVLSPSFGPEDESIYFLAHADGYRNLYEYNTTTGRAYKLTDFLTGISGITDLAPAYSVSKKTGEIAYTLYGNDRYQIYMARPEEFDKQPVSLTLAETGPAQLPPGNNRVLGLVGNNLKRYPTMEDTAFAQKPYKPQFELDYIGSTGVGVGTSQFGTYASGGVTALFSDVLKRHQLITNLQVQGEIQDIGGYASYINRETRFNWGSALSHIPIRYDIPYVQFDSLEVEGGKIPVTQFIIERIRIFQDQFSAFGQYPLSKQLRFELGGSITRYGYSRERITYNYSPYGTLLGTPQRKDLSAPDPFYVGQVYGAYVGDNTNFGITGPLDGYRYRFQVQKMFADYDLHTTLVDYRKYFFNKPVSFGVRALHYARYGPDAESLYPLYVGDNYYVRGYSYGSYNQGQQYNADYASRDALAGSKMAVINAEVRLPLSGPERLTFIKSKYLFTTLVGFVDGGFATNSYNDLNFTWQPSKRSTSGTIGDTGDDIDNYPIYSTGLALRINLFGYAVLEPYAAIPFQRQDKDITFGLFIRGSGW
ncbi:MAG: PD40 domain-containing protein [Bacteroidales bacterium]|nr:PD40 domain-containing protein [Bacteroidales bacterium]